MGTALQQHLQRPLVCGVGQALRAWRAAVVTRPAGQSGAAAAAAKAAIMAQLCNGLQQQPYNATRRSLRRSGVPDFVAYWGCPGLASAGFGSGDQLAELRHSLHFHEDQAAHIMKLTMKHWREQPPSGVLVAGSAAATAAALQGGSQWSRPAVGLICGEQLKEATRSCPELPEAMLLASADARNVLLARALLYSTRLQQELVRLGHVSEAIALRLLAAGNQDSDWSGLQPSTRMVDMCSMRAMLHAALGTLQNTVEAAAGSSHVGLV